MSDLDSKKARLDTPACEQYLHFNNAGAALQPLPVQQALLHYVNLEAEIGGYEAEELAQEIVTGLYQSAATFLNANSHDIAIMDGATRAWGMAFYSIPWQKGDVILTGIAEYESNYLAFLQMQKRAEVVIEVIPNDEFGQISLSWLAERLTQLPRPKLIAITHVPTNGGLINPAAEIGVLARQHQVLYLLDACQSAGQINLDVQKLHCDFLSFAGRKFLRGPRGTGVLYVNPRVSQDLEPSSIDLQSAEWRSEHEYRLAPGARRFEQYEFNLAMRAGLKAAFDYALGWGMPAIETRVQELGQSLRQHLATVQGVEVLDLGQRQCGIVSFRLAGWEPLALRQALAQERIHIWTSLRRYTLLDMQARGLAEVCRASIHYYNTEEEIDLFCAALERLRARKK